MALAYRQLDIEPLIRDSILTYSAWWQLERRYRIHIRNLKRRMPFWPILSVSSSPHSFRGNIEIEGSRVGALRQIANSVWENDDHYSHGHYALVIIHEEWWQCRKYRARQNSSAKHLINASSRRWSGRYKYENCRSNPRKWNREHR